MQNQTFAESVLAQIDLIQTELVRNNLSQAKRDWLAGECDRLNDILADLQAK